MNFSDLKRKSAKNLKVKMAKRKKHKEFKNKKKHKKFKVRKQKKDTKQKKGASLARTPYKLHLVELLS